MGTFGDDISMYILVMVVVIQLCQNVYTYALCVGTSQDPQMGNIHVERCSTFLSSGNTD